MHRLVWSRIWSVLSEYFISVGCHPNAAVASFAVDSLRQLATRFLERDELANFTFQNEFLRPFVVVIRQSQSVNIREMIIRCVSQVGNSVLLESCLFSLSAAVQSTCLAWAAVLGLLNTTGAAAE